MTVRRVASTAAALSVGGIAAVASYTHMRDLALQYGQPDVIATMLPISVDGMLVVATVALGDGRRYRWSAWLAFWIGVAASVIANVLAARDDVVARAISAWPAVAFLLVVEILTRAGRHEPDLPTEPAIELEPELDLPTPVAMPADDTPDDMTPDTPDRPASTPDRIAQLRAGQPDMTQADVAEAVGLSVRTVARHWQATHPTNGRVPELVGGAP